MGIAAALRSCGYPLRTMEEEYGEATAQGLFDVTWIPDVTAKGWVIFSKDDGLKSGHELRAIRNYGAKVFLLPSQSMKEADQIERFCHHRFRIAMKARKRGPAIYIVYRRRPEPFKFPLG